MKKVFLLSLISLLFYDLSAQQLVFLEKDTLTYASRTGGTKLDSVDLYYTANTTLNPGGAWYNPFGSFQNSFTSFIECTGSPFYQIPKTANHYTSLPHLGFMYSFGSKGIQFVHADYQQQLNKKTGLNFSYDQNSIGAMMRNDQFKNNLLQLSLDHIGLRYLFFMKLHFQNSSINQSGGIQDSVSTKSFPLEFIPVRKTNAKSKQIQFELATQQVLAFRKDSLKILGLTYKNNWSIRNRTYSEQDSIYGLYDTVYIDSFETRDQFQLAKIQNALGFYYRTKKITGEALLNHSYWDYQNLARHRDTIELNAEFNLSLNLRKMKLENAFKYNFIGAKGEWSEAFRLKYADRSKRAGLDLQLTYKLPDVFQRAYFSNNQFWNLSSLKVQGINSLSAYFTSLNKFGFSGKLIFKNYSNTYFYLNDTWRNDTLKQINVISIQSGITIPWKTLSFHPLIGFSYQSINSAYLPVLDFRTRISYQKKLFKAKKMVFLLGVDLKYQSTYTVLDYQSSLGLYRFNQQSLPQTKTAFFELDAFTGFQISEFRFYIRVENIDYNWVNQDIQFLRNYPITPMIVRLGLTWDFFD